MKKLTICLSLISLLFYLVGYHSFWHYFNKETWLLDFLFKFAGNASQNQELTVSKTSGIIWYEDNLSLLCFILSIALSLLVVLISFRVKPIKIDKQFKAIMVTFACVILIMDIHFLLNNSLNIM